MFTLAILYRYLSVVDNGAWIFYQTAIILIDTFRTGMLNTAVVKMYAGVTKQRGKEVIGSTWLLAVIISSIFIILSIPAYFFLNVIDNKGLIIFFKYLAVNLFFSMPTLIGLCKAQGEIRFDRIMYLRIANNGLFLLFIVILALIGKIDLQSIIYANLIAIGLAALLSLLKGWSGVQYFKFRTWQCVKEIFHFGKFTVATSISSSLFRVTDTFMINFLLGPAALAIYNLGQRLMEIVEIPLRSFTATAMPALSTAFNQNNKDEFINILKKNTGVITILLIPLLAAGFIFADFAIGLIGGGKYRGTEAANVFRVFVTFALLFPADRFLAISLDAIHKPNINLIKVVCMLFINLIADYIGIYITGNVYGIAIATLFPILFAVMISYWYLKNNFVQYNFWSNYSVGFTTIQQSIRQYRSRKTLP